MTSRLPQVLSADTTYEYEFRRVWDPSAPLALWVMRNPSKIDGLEPGGLPVPADGKTIARCAGFTRREGWGGLVTWNVFAYRADDADDLADCDDPVGPDNDAVLHRLLNEAGVVVAAWGAAFPKQYTGRIDGLRDLLRAEGAMCLGKTKTGQPKHPLYLPPDTELVPL